MPTIDTVPSHRLGVLLTVLLLALPATSVAQESTAEASAWQRAQALSRQGRWGEAASAYQEHLADHDADAWSWFALGSILHGSSDFAGAVRAFHQALEHKIGVPAVAHYNLASALARLDRNDQALEHLAQAGPSGLWSAETLRADPDIGPLANVPRFAELAQEADLAHHPCQLLPAYQQFDFWLGSWQARIPTGFPAAHDEITKSEDGCVITQTWRGTLGNEGRSYSYYDASRERWLQTWIGKNGTIATMEGKLIGDAMMLETTSAAAGSRTRTTWTPRADSTVEVRTESSTDDGVSWTPAGLLLYHRAE